MLPIFFKNILSKNSNSTYLNCWASGRTKKNRQDAQFSLTATKYVSGDVVTSNARGIDHLRNPRLNRGLAFTLAERQAFGIHGLLSSGFRTIEQQIAICKLSFDRYRSLLNKYLYLSELLDTNETLFYSLLNQDIHKYMPIIDSPTIGLVSQKFGLVYKRSRGLFLSIHDRGHVIDVLNNWPERDVRAIVVTDGERILGLGDLGAHGMALAQGKVMLLTAIAGIKPHQCLPVCFDIGTNNQSLIEDPLYIGLRETRYPQSAYDELVEEFLHAVKRLYGSTTLVMMEDIATHNAYRLLNRFRDDYCVFNNDIQATAAVVVSGLMVGCYKVTNQKLGDNVYLFYGAGSMGVGIASLLCEAMVEEGYSSEDARKKCYLFDADGILSHKRCKVIPPHALHFSRDLEPETDLEACINNFKVTCLIGTTMCGGAFTPDVLKGVAHNAEKPMIFTLSNSTDQSECTAQEAYDNTGGRCLFASGSPFRPVTFQEQDYFTGQAHNYYVYPGLAMGVVAAKACRVTDAMFLCAAKTLASKVTDADISVGRIYPNDDLMYTISKSIAANIVSVAYDNNLTSLNSKPKDYRSFVQEQAYEFNYTTNNIPTFYKYPESKNVNLKNIEVLHKGLLPRNRKRRSKNDPPIIL